MMGRWKEMDIKEGRRAPRLEKCVNTQNLLDNLFITESTGPFIQCEINQYNM